MGFSAIRPTTNQVTALASLEMWSTRADAAIMHVYVQWAAMLAGMSAAEAARANAFDLANYYRAHNLPIVRRARPVALSVPRRLRDARRHSDRLGTFQSSPQLQARYIHLPLFAALGMVDTQLRPRAALAVWDSLYARRVQ